MSPRIPAFKYREVVKRLRNLGKAILDDIGMDSDEFRSV